MLSDSCNSATPCACRGAVQRGGAEGRCRGVVRRGGADRCGAQALRPASVRRHQMAVADGTLGAAPVPLAYHTPHRVTPRGVPYPFVCHSP